MASLFFTIFLQRTAPFFPQFSAVPRNIRVREFPRMEVRMDIVFVGLVILFAVVLCLMIEGIGASEGGR